MIFVIKSYLRFTYNAVFRVPVPKLAILDTRRSLSIHDTISLQNIFVSVCSPKIEVQKLQSINAFPGKYIKIVWSRLRRDIHVILLT